jgi:uncharacterized protein (DUF2126 family)
LLARPEEEYGFDAEDAEAFVQRLATRIGVSGKFVRPAYEDPYHYVWKERQAPADLDVAKMRLETEEERARLGAILEAGLGKVTGYVLPIARGRLGDPDWVSSAWPFRAAHLFLAPGDSPMGLRLPLDSLPWVRKADYPYLIEQDLVEGAQHGGELRSHAVTGVAAGGVIGVRFEADFGLLFSAHTRIRTMNCQWSTSLILGHSAAWRFGTGSSWRRWPESATGSSAFRPSDTGRA